jgi:hypothetical protein
LAKLVEYPDNTSTKRHREQNVASYRNRATGELALQRF